MWKMSKGGYVRFTTAEKSFAIPTQKQIDSLDTHLFANYQVHLADAKSILVIDEYTHTSLTIVLNDNKVVRRNLKTSTLPEQLKFYNYGLKPVENTSNLPITCSITQAMAW